MPLFALQRAGFDNSRCASGESTHASYSAILPPDRTWGLDCVAPKDKKGRRGS
jgi:hypothetical protein